MLTSTELLELTQRLDLSSTACEVIDQVRASPPSRRVAGRRSNVCTRFPSRKMKCVIQAESHRVELAGVYLMEHDGDVLEYYDQPPAILLSYTSKTQRPVTVHHTPDFFVLRNDGVGWEEWKNDEELAILAERMPHRYQRSEAGIWRCPPGQAYAAAMGLQYRMCTSGEINWILQRNLQFLDDYWRNDMHVSTPPLASDGTAHSIIKSVSDTTGVTLAQLITQVGGMQDGLSADCKGNIADCVYYLIAHEQLYVDLGRVPLSDPDHVQVYLPVTQPSQIPYSDDAAASPDASNAGAMANWGALQCKDIQDVETPLSETRRQAQELVMRASEDDLCIALQRMEAIRPLLNQQQTREEPVAVVATSPVPIRTLRQWKHKYLEAELKWGSGFIGLLPHWSSSGNRTRRLSQPMIDLMSEVIETHYENIKRKHIKLVYGELVLQCEERGLQAPDYKTFRQEITRRPQHQQALAREGKRAAYTRKPFYWELELTTPRHGERPLELVHLDHTQLDIELVCSKTGQGLGRPWASFLVDAFSRRILVVLLTFDPPSYRTCMMILRECVRRHGRLPQTVIVDNGREFNSVYFEALLARYECSKKSRPYAEPHFGSVCERLFGTTNTQFLHNLTGNTQASRQMRTMVMSTDPRRHAHWTLGALHGCLCDWAYEVYDQIDHPTLGQSPRRTYEVGLAQSGCRPHMQIDYDQDFILTTLPSTLKGSAQIHPSHGITLNHIDYWSDAFLDPRYAYTRAPVRYDPFNAGIAFAYTGQRWVRCISAHYAELHGRSERELALMAQELRRQHEVMGRKFKVTAARLARFIREVEAKEPHSGSSAPHAAIRQQRLKDNENNEVMACAEGLIDPVVARGDCAGVASISCNVSLDAPPGSEQTELAPPAARANSQSASAHPTTNPGRSLETFGDY